MAETDLFGLDDDDFTAIGAKPAAPVSGVAAVRGVVPEAAAKALKDGPGVGVPPSLAMHDPKPVEDMAHTRRVETILNRSPTMRSWSLGEPAKVAATQDDFDALEKIGSIIDSRVKNLTLPFRLGWQEYQQSLATIKHLETARKIGPLTPEQERERMSALNLAQKAKGHLDPLAAIGSVLFGPTAEALTDLGARSPGKSREQSTLENLDILGLAATMGIPVGAGVSKGRAPPLTGARGAADVPPAAPTPGGDFTINETGRVMGDAGEAVFTSPKAAAQWIVKNGSKSPNQLFEIEAGTNGVYHVRQRNKVEPFKQLALPGVARDADAAYAAQAQATEQTLVSLQEAAAVAKTQTRSPGLMKEFVDQASPGTMVTFDAAKFDDLLSTDVVPMDQIPVLVWNEINQKAALGQTFEMSLGDYVSLTAGKPWAEQVNKIASMNGGVSSADAEELVKPLIEITPMKDFGPMTAYKPGGSNPGGIHSEWLIKGDQMAPDRPREEVATRARNEVLTSALLNKLSPGLAPEMKLVALEGNYNGGLGVASKMLGGLQPFQKSNPEHVQKAREDFAIQAWLGHWDVMGQGFDNIYMQGKQLVNVDLGGAMLFRAQGMPKEFGPVANEWNTLRDSATAPEAAQIYQGMSSEQLLASAKKLEKIKDKDILAITDEYGLPQLGQILIDRKKDILAKAGVADADLESQLLDDGVSPYEYFTKGGKEFYEPEDLDVSDFDGIELAKFMQAKNVVKAAIERVVKERFLDRLFKDRAAAGMSEPQYDAYSRRTEKAFKDLTEKLWKQVHANVKGQYTKEWNAAYHRNFPGVLNELMSRPEVKAEHILRYTKVQEDELRKDNALVDDKGEPLVYYHGSEHWNIGTPDNPQFEKQGYDVISFSTSPKFANNWKDMNSFNPYEEAWEFDDEYAQGLAKTIYVVNIKAKNPADFRKHEDVLKAATWFAKKDYQFTQFETGGEHTKQQVLMQLGLSPEIKKGTSEAVLNAIRKRFISQLSKGSYNLWERPDMWKEFGWDAAHMKENSTSEYVNISVEDGQQVYFRYRIPLERQGVKLSPELKKLYPKELWEKLPNNMFSKESGASADEVAGELGFTSGEEMLTRLSDFERARGDVPFRQYIKKSAEGLARQVTEAEVGNLLDPDRILEDARALFVAPEAESLLIEDFQLLAQSLGAPLSAQQVKDFAVANFGKTSAKAARQIRNYERAVKKWGDAAEIAMAKGKSDYISAFAAKQKQLINWVQLSEAHKFADRWAKLSLNIQRWAGNKTLVNMGQEYLDRIHQVLFVHGIAVRRDPDELRRGLEGSLGEWVQRKRDVGEDIYEAMLDPKEPKNLTVDEIVELDKMLTSIAKAGRAAKQVTADGKKMELASAIEEAATSSARLPSKPLDKNLGDWHPWKPAKIGSRFDAAHRILESLFDYLDDGPRGIHNRVLQDGATEAANTVDRLQQQIYSPILDEFEKIPKATRALYTQKLESEVLFDPRDNLPITIRRGDLLSIALNMGTESNKIKLLEGYGAREDEVLELLNKHLTKEEAKFIQFTWDRLEELFPLADANARELRGFGLSKLKHTPIEIAGEKLQGGYYPVMYDPKFNTHPVGDEFDAESPTIKPFRILGTPTGFEQQRSGYTGPLLLSLDRTLKQHLRDVFVRIAYGEYVGSARRFILDPKIRGLWVQKLGQEYYDLLMPWLEFQVFDVGMPIKDTAVIQNILRKLRQNMTLSTMGFSYSVGIKQSLGALPAISELGLVPLLDGYRRFYLAAMTGKLDDLIYNKSEEMQYRHWNLEQNVRDTHADIHVLDVTATPLQLFYKKWGDASMRYINFMDKWTISGATWTAAYSKARYEMQMNEGDSIRFADKLVRKTQGTGRPKDLPAVQRPNNEFQRILTFAYTWPGRYYNLQMETVREFRTGDKKTGVRKMFWLLLAMPIIQALADGELPEKEDRDDPEAWLYYSLRKILLTNMGNAVFFRDAVNIVDRKLDGKYAGPPRTPISALFDAGDKILFSKSQKTWFKTWANLLGMLGLLPGGGQIGKTGQFLIDVKEKRQRPKNFMDWHEGLTSGKITE